MGMWRVGKHFEFARVIAMNNSKFLDGNELMKTNTVFLVAGLYDISKELYTYTRNNRYNVQCGMQTDMLTYGNSSFTNKTTWFKLGDGKALGKLTFKYVMVNRNTRRSSPLPDWFRDKYPRLTDPDSYQWMKPLLVPPHAYSLDKMVEYSDTDSNKHANNTFFLRACFDVAATACSAGYFKHFSGDFFKYHTQKMWVLYSKETNVGSKLKVYTWDSPDSSSSSDLVFFQIKENDIPLFHAAAKMFPTTNKPRL